MAKPLHVLLVHGAGGGAWEWNIWCGVLAAHGYKPLALELKVAPSGIAATGLADYQAQVAQALHALPRPRVLIGASLGGLLALQCAEDADGLVLINPLPPTPWHTHLGARAWPEVVPWQAQARLASSRHAMPDADEGGALFAFRRWRDESGAVLRQAYAGVAASQPRCPTLFVLSEDDTDVPIAAGEAMVQAWRCDVIRLGSASHVGPLLGRKAAAQSAQTVDWLNSLQLGG